MLLGLLSLSHLGCSKTPTEPSVSEPRGTSLLLQVVDAQDNPIPGALISSGSGLLSVDSSGHRLFENLSPGRFVARVDALGFLSATSVVELQEGAHVGAQVKLLPRPAPLPFQASQGGTLQTAQVRLSIPPDAVVDSMGQPVTGSVEVTIAPRDPLSSAPGPMEGISSLTGETAQLESLFMAEVSLWSGGAPVQLAPGRSATLEFLLPQELASQFKVGDTVPAWWFDLDAGLWREEGAGIVRASQAWPGRLAWTAVVNHFTSWAGLVPWELTGMSCVNVRVVDSEGRPLPNVPVTARGLYYTWVHATQYTGLNGQVCEAIKRGYLTYIHVGPPAAPLAGTQVGGQYKASCGSVLCEAVTVSLPTPICTVGAYEPCPYSGPEGTQGVGQCRAGLKRCNLSGSAWSACQGEILPLEEDCRTPFDDDCDGTVNEHCSCPGQGSPCYGGPAATEGVGLCQQGTVRCDSFGTRLCLGQRLPQAERCWTPEDEDCDGVGACSFGDWSPSGPLVMARAEHTATLLPDGKVLVAGGSGRRSLLTSAEVYDPASGTWSVTGTLALTRTQHTATLLPDGKVLVAGGFNNGGNMATAEVYNPASGTWSATGSLATARSKHTATLLPDGKVLVAGGTGSGTPLTMAEVYDPASGTWSVTGTLARDRSVHTATSLHDGRVLIVGGGGSGAFVLPTAEVYHPASGTWSATGSLATARTQHTATLLPDGKVLVAGGHSYALEEPVAAAEVYDPASGIWSVTGSLATGRDEHTASLLPDGGVLVAGGKGRSGDLATAEVYRPATGTWGATGSLAGGRRRHTATVLLDGGVLVTGGIDGGGTVAETELYSP